MQPILRRMRFKKLFQLSRVQFKKRFERKIVLPPFPTPLSPPGTTMLYRTCRQHTATHCNTLQHTATHCNILQHAVQHCNTLLANDGHLVPHMYARTSNTLQHTATHCNIYCNTYCNTSKQPPPLPRAWKRTNF